MRKAKQSGGVLTVRVGEPVKLALDELLSVLINDEYPSLNAVLVKTVRGLVYDHWHKLSLKTQMSLTNGPTVRRGSKRISKGASHVEQNLESSGSVASIECGPCDDRTIRGEPKSD
jgi:hypothetical protein